MVKVTAAVVLLAASTCFSADVTHGQPPSLAYLAVSSGYWEIWLSNADGTGARQLTRSKKDKTRLSWYPDGKSLLAGCNDGHVVRVDLAGTETTIPLEQFPIVDAVISPDGKYLAYSFSTAIDGNDLWIANANGAGAERLVKMTKLQHEPVWSPDGRYLYFLSGDGGQAHDIWRISLATKSLEQMTVGSLYHFDIALSPKGELAYSNNQSGNYEIYLERNGKPEAITKNSALDARPAFSPDGNVIVFESTRGGMPNLWQVNLQSGLTQQITFHKDGARDPAWSPRVTQ
jgi:TolB protein